MAMEECGLERLSEVVGHVDRCVDSVKKHKVSFDPVAKGEKLYVDMACTCSGFLCVTHCCAAIVVFVEEGCCFLWNVEVP